MEPGRNSKRESKFVNLLIEPLKGIKWELSANARTLALAVVHVNEYLIAIPLRRIHHTRGVSSFTKIFD